MHKLWRRSLTTILRSTGTRYRPLLYSPADHVLSEEIYTTKRWCSVFTSGSSKSIVAHPIWLRNPSEVSKKDYNEFYKKTFNDDLDPLASSHFTIKDKGEFTSILYVPSIAPTGEDDTVNPKTKNIRLYIKRVFIPDDFDGELFPWYLSFIKGVVDSNNLPSNVSCKFFQENSCIASFMKKCLVTEAFGMIQGITSSYDREHRKFWTKYGKQLKEGFVEDVENRKFIAPILRFFSSQSEDMISLDEYVENMKAKQNGIYYIAADRVASAKITPYLEKLAKKDIFVLVLADPVDKTVLRILKSYKGNHIIDLTKVGIDLGDGVSGDWMPPFTEDLLLPGLDFEHWLIVRNDLLDGLTKDEIIETYVREVQKILIIDRESAQKKIYAVYTKDVGDFYCYGVLMPQSSCMLFEADPSIKYVLPDVYLDAEKQLYGGEPYVNGEVVQLSKKEYEDRLKNNMKRIEDQFNDLDHY